MIDVLRTIRDESNPFQNVKNLLIESMTQDTFDKVEKMGYKCFTSTCDFKGVIPTNRLIITFGIAKYYKQLTNSNFQDIENIHQMISNPIETSNTNIKLTPIPNTRISPIDLSQNIKYTSIALNMQQLNCEIFQYLDLKSLFKCRRVNQRWLYDGYSPFCIYHIDISQVIEYVNHKESCNTTTMSNNIGINTNCDSIVKVIPIQCCQGITMTTQDILSYAHKFPWANSVRNLNDDNNNSTKGKNTNYFETITHWQVAKLKYLTINMCLQQYCRYDEQIDIKCKFFHGVEWLTKWIQDHRDGLKRITILLDNQNATY